MPFSPDQLVLIDRLITARVVAVTDRTDVATAASTFGGPATMTSTTGEYLPSSVLIGSGLQDAQLVG